MNFETMWHCAMADPQDQLAEHQARRAIFRDLFKIHNDPMGLSYAIGCYDTGFVLLGCYEDGCGSGSGFLTDKNEARGNNYGYGSHNLMFSQSGNRIEGGNGYGYANGDGNGNGYDWFRNTCELEGDFLSNGRAENPYLFRVGDECELDTPTCNA